MSKDTVLNDFTVSALSSLIVGVGTTFTFYPWDKAINIAIRKQRSIWLKANFTSPWMGLSQSLIFKPLNSCVYFFAQGELQSNLTPYLLEIQGMDETKAQFCLGLTAGTFDAIIKNPLSAIKIHMWGTHDGSFSNSTKEMWQKGGLRPFFNGTSPSMMRDGIFGATYESIRSFARQSLETDPNLQQHATTSHLIADGAAAAIATTASSLFHYAKIYKCNTPPGQKPVSTLTSIHALFHSATQHPTTHSKIRCLQHSLQLGPNTARVALSMALGQTAVDKLRTYLSSTSQNAHTPVTNRSP